MNENIYCSELERSFSWAKERRYEWLRFRYECREDIEKFKKMNIEKPRTISQKTIKKTKLYLGKINAIIAGSMIVRDEN